MPPGLFSFTEARNLTSNAIPSVTMHFCCRSNTRPYIDGADISHIRKHLPTSFTLLQKGYGCPTFNGYTVETGMSLCVYGRF